MIYVQIINIILPLHINKLSSIIIHLFQNLLFLQIIEFESLNFDLQALLVSRTKIILFKYGFDFYSIFFFFY